MLAFARRALLVVAAVVVAAAAVLVTPPGDLPARVDALVVLAGGRGERLAHAERLVYAGRARALAISHGFGWPEGRKLCRARALRVREQRVPVICFSPEPDTTKGEAMAIRRLAAGSGWKTIGLVTSTFHARRAVLLARRCAPGLDIASAAAAPDWTRGKTWLNVLREEGAIVKALTVDRDC